MLKVADTPHSIEEPAQTQESIREEHMKNEFFQRLKNPNEWKGLRDLSFPNREISFADQLPEAYRYFLKRGEFEACKNFSILRKFVLMSGDKEKYDQIDFFGIADQVARELLREGDVELARKIRNEFSNGKKMLVDCQKEASEGFCKRLDELCMQFEDVGLKLNRDKLREILTEDKR